MTTDEIKNNHPITVWVTDRGGKIRYMGGKPTTNLCPSSEHKNGHNCVTLEPNDNIWHCNDCDTGGSVIDWLIFEKGVTKGDAIRELGGDLNCEQTDGKTQEETSTLMSANSPAPKVQPSGAGKISKIYDYTNENNQLVYQVIRYEPKSFRQRQPDGENWKWNLDGITRVLYNLPKVINNQFICLTEGEKDADTLNELGFIATTNAGGSSSWLPAYAETLKGKDVYIFPDNDAAGEKLYKSRLISLEGKVKSAKKIVVPKEYKDVTEWMEALPDDESRRLKLLDVMDKTAHAIEPLPLYTIYEMEERFKEYVNNLPKRSFSLSKLSPRFGQISKNLMPGELVMIMGDTGQGKTAIMQAIAKAANPVPTLFFELELPLEAMFARSIQMESKCYEQDVLNDYKDSKFSMRDRFKNLEHILTCDRSGMSMEDIEKLITMSELKFGSHPTLVMIDYMGLVKNPNYRSRYEIMAFNAQQAKVIAKRTGTVVMMGSQVGRPGKDEEGRKVARKHIGLHDARGAGELEESSNLVLGVTRPEDAVIKLEVLKNTRGPVGGVIDFAFNADMMQITPL